MAAPNGFEYLVRGNEVLILHRGTRATTLRGAKADTFLERLQGEDHQLLMARVTGNYRRGNERTARDHPRNAS